MAFQEDLYGLLSPSTMLSFYSLAEVTTKAYFEELEMIIKSKEARYCNCPRVAGAAMI